MTRKFGGGIERDARDSVADGDAVCQAYAGDRFEFTGGELTTVVFEVADDASADVETHLRAAISRD